MPGPLSVILLFILLVTAWKHQHVLQEKHHTYVVIGVEHAGNVLCQIPVQNGLDVIPDVDCRQADSTLIKRLGDTADIFF